jgi:hypothetical protein
MSCHMQDDAAMSRKKPKALSSKKQKTAVSPRSFAPAYVPSPSEDVPLTIAQACAFFGGDRPIDPSTYYRGVKAGRYPKPFPVSANVVRVMRSWCERARAALAAQSDPA